jgi:phage terminase small subunit
MNIPDHPIQTLITFADIPEHGTSARVNLIEFGKELHSKAEILELQGKTFSFVRTVRKNVFKRNWLDRESAEEWKKFVLEMSEKYDVKILDIEISIDPNF